MATKKILQLPCISLLDTTFNISKHKRVYHIGVDEAGRGPLFGRVYAAAVVLPDPRYDIEKVNDIAYNMALFKDSKKFTSTKKLGEAYQHVVSHSLAHHVAYCDENEIDTLNIRKATHKAMHHAVEKVIEKLGCALDDVILWVDGNDFTPYTKYNKERETIEQAKHVCIKSGDNTYTHIAAASICAKVERDAYIEALCDEHAHLDDFYGIRSNKGYGAKVHLEGIKTYGITQWHRKTFGICKTFVQ